VTTANFLDPNSHINFRAPTADWQPRWPVDAAVIGDSFTFCNNEYPDCWAQQLDTQHQLSVVNLGLAGTGTISHLRVLQTFTLPYKPRIVIWQWWGNDFNDDYALLNNDTSMLIAPAQERATRSNHSGLEQWLKNNSAIYVVAELALNGFQTEPVPEYVIDRYSVRSGAVYLRYGRPYIERAFDLTNKRNQPELAASKQASSSRWRRLAKEDFHANGHLAHTDQGRGVSGLDGGYARLRLVRNGQRRTQDNAGFVRGT